MWSTLLRMKRMEYGRRSQSPNALKNSSRLNESNVLPLKKYLRWNFKKWTGTMEMSEHLILITHCSVCFTFLHFWRAIPCYQLNSWKNMQCVKTKLKIGQGSETEKGTLFLLWPKGKQLKHHSKSWCWKNPRTQFSSNVGKALGWSLGG